MAATAAWASCSTALRVEQKHCELRKWFSEQRAQREACVQTLLSDGERVRGPRMKRDVDIPENGCAAHRTGTSWCDDVSHRTQRAMVASTQHSVVSDLESDPGRRATTQIPSRASFSMAFAMAQQDVNLPADLGRRLYSAETQLYKSPANFTLGSCGTLTVEDMCQQLSISDADLETFLATLEKVRLEASQLVANLEGRLCNAESEGDAAKLNSELLGQGRGMRYPFVTTHCVRSKDERGLARAYLEKVARNYECLIAYLLDKSFSFDVECSDKVAKRDLARTYWTKANTACGHSCLWKQELQDLKAECDAALVAKSECEQEIANSLEISRTLQVDLKEARSSAEASCEQVVQRLFEEIQIVKAERDKSKQTLECTSCALTELNFELCVAVRERDASYEILERADRDRAELQDYVAGVEQEALAKVRQQEYRAADLGEQLRVVAAERDAARASLQQVGRELDEASHSICILQEQCEILQAHLERVGSDESQVVDDLRRALIDSQSNRSLAQRSSDLERDQHECIVSELQQKLSVAKVLEIEMKVDLTETEAERNVAHSTLAQARHDYEIVKSELHEHISITSMAAKQLELVLNATRAEEEVMESSLERACRDQNRTLSELEKANSHANSIERSFEHERREHSSAISELRHRAFVASEERDTAQKLSEQIGRERAEAIADLESVLRNAQAHREVAQRSLEQARQDHEFTVTFLQNQLDEALEERDAIRIRSDQLDLDRAQLVAALGTTNIHGEVAEMMLEQTRGDCERNVYDLRQQLQLKQDSVTSMSHQLRLAFEDRDEARLRMEEYDWERRRVADDLQRTICASHMQCKDSQRKLQQTHCDYNIEVSDLQRQLRDALATRDAAFHNSSESQQAEVELQQRLGLTEAELDTARAGLGMIGHSRKVSSLDENLDGVCMNFAEHHCDHMGRIAELQELVATLEEERDDKQTSLNRINCARELGCKELIQLRFELGHTEQKLEGSNAALEEESSSYLGLIEELRSQISVSELECNNATASLRQARMDTEWDRLIWDSTDALIDVERRRASVEARMEVLNKGLEHECELVRCLRNKVDATMAERDELLRHQEQWLCTKEISRGLGQAEFGAFEQERRTLQLLRMYSDGTASERNPPVAHCQFHTGKRAQLLEPRKGCTKLQADHEQFKEHIAMDLRKTEHLRSPFGNYLAAASAGPLALSFIGSPGVERSVHPCSYGDTSEDMRDHALHVSPQVHHEPSSDITPLNSGFSPTCDAHSSGSGDADCGGVQWFDSI